MIFGTQTRYAVDKFGLFDGVKMLMDAGYPALDFSFFGDQEFLHGEDGLENARKLRKMAEEEQTHVACLRGIYRMVTGERCQIHTSPVDLEDPPVALRRCYGREMRCLAAYEARSDDSEYGPVFAQLAQQEREHCKNILLLMNTITF